MISGFAFGLGLLIGSNPPCVDFWDCLERAETLSAQAHELRIQVDLGRVDWSRYRTHPLVVGLPRAHYETTPIAARIAADAGPAPERAVCALAGLAQSWMTVYETYQDLHEQEVERQGYFRTDCFNDSFLVLEAARRVTAHALRTAFAHDVFGECRDAAWDLQCRQNISLCLPRRQGTIRPAEPFQAQLHFRGPD